MVVITLMDDDTISDEIIGKGVYQIPSKLEGEEEVTLELMKGDTPAGKCVFKFNLI